MEWWKPLETDKINNNNLLLIILAQYHVNHSNDDAQLSNSVQFESLRTLFMIQSINNVSLFSRGNLILLGKHIRLNQSTMYFLTNFYIRCCCCSECVFRLQRIDSRSSDSTFDSLIYLNFSHFWALWNAIRFLSFCRENCQLLSCIYSKSHKYAILFWKCNVND